MAKLKLIKDGIELQSYDLDKIDKTSMVLGRADGCDIRLDDRNIGREHLVLSVHGDNVSVHKKSKFGKLSINGVESNDAKIHAGDVVYIADYRLELEVDLNKKQESKVFESKILESKVHEFKQSEELHNTKAPILQLNDSIDKSEQMNDIEMNVSVNQSVIPEENILSTNEQPNVDLPFEMQEANESINQSKMMDLQLGEIAVEPASLENISNNEKVMSGDILMPLDVGGSNELPKISEEAVNSNAVTNVNIESPQSIQEPQKTGTVNLDLNPLQMSEPIQDSNSKLNEVLNTVQTSMRTNSSLTNADRTKVDTSNHMEVKLIFNQGDANTQEFVIEKPMITIGKGSDCDVELNDKSVSRKHAVIKTIGAKYFLIDQGSSNGTFVNGERITEYELSSDDVIQIGSIEFQFLATDLNYANQKSKFISMPEDTKHFGSQRNNNQVEFNEQPVSGNEFQFSSALNEEPKVTKKESKSLLAKLPKSARLALVAVVALIAVLMLFSDDSKSKKSKKANTNVSVKDGDAFNKLPEEKKQFVINTYQMAMDFYKNLEYERALFEINKVLEILPGGYKDSLDLKGYAEKAIEIQKSKDDEKKRKEEQQKVAQQVADLIAQLEKLVKEKKVAEAKEIISQVFELDPENATALRLKQELEELLQKSKLEEEEKLNQEEKRRVLENIINEGKVLFKKGKYYEVMDKMIHAPDTGCTDQKLLNKAAQLIQQSKQALKNKVKPHLEAAKTAMSVQDYVKARDEFFKALKIDYKNAEAKKGISEIREILHRRSQQLYTQAIMAESVSDFEGSRNLYKECLIQAMPDDIYYGRCHRKLQRFRVLDKGDQPSERQVASDPIQPQSSSAGADPQMPTVDINESKQ